MDHRVEFLVRLGTQHFETRATARDEVVRGHHFTLRPILLA
jgi:hypothetical protein